MPSSTADGPRGLRDRPLGRILILLVVLAAAVAVARGCSDSDPDISKDEAIELAREVLIFPAESVQVRFVRQGLPPRGFWAVSFYDGKAVSPDRVQLIKVDAKTGEIVDDGLREPDADAPE